MLNITNDVSKEVLTAILSGIDEGIHVVNPEGKTIFYNDVAAKHDGLSMEEVIDKPLLSVFPSLNENTSTLLKVLKTKRAIYNQTQSYMNIHGKKIETMNTTVPIHVKGELVGAVEIAKDYTRIKMLSERLLDLHHAIKPTKGKGTIANSPVKHNFDSILTQSDRMMAMKKEAAKLAKSKSPILVYGESGTGKELFVQGIHHASNRSSGPFIAQNCAAIPETLLESILFGTSKGSYTGAIERAGIFELADGGTLFLDEIHAMPIDLQAKLLRVLEDGIVRRIGSTKNISVDVRIIAALNVHPKQALEDNKIRTDLFYRLNVLTFELPSLRERLEDINFLANYFVQKFNEELGKQIKGMNHLVEKLFKEYHWPGNVRELKHAVEYMMNVCEGETLTEEDLPAILKQSLLSKRGLPDKENLSLKDNLLHFEKELIVKALSSTDGNIKKASALLQIPRQTLQYKIQKHSLGAE